MKTEKEIREKIEELMEKAANSSMVDEHEAICNNIDALLWVIGDESGKPI